MKFIGIIGDPIEHSLSPRMQNACFRRMNLPLVYLPFRVRPDDLKSFLEKAVREKMIGLNVTIPHKERILPLLDWISPEAQSIGAVNTVVMRGKKMLGYNTDRRGYLRSLKKETGYRPRKKTVLILGAGGAARSILYGLARAGAKKIYLANRTRAKMLQLARKMRHRLKTPIETVSLRRSSLEKIFPSVDLLVNATSVGLKGTRLRFLPLSFLRQGALVSDLVYRPLVTPLLREAKRKGFKIHRGIGMLLYQGGESFRLWTGRRPDLAVMRKALLDALK